MSDSIDFSLTVIDISGLLSTISVSLDEQDDNISAQQSTNNLRG